MRTETLICTCGEPLAEQVTPGEVITLEGLAVIFRRHTDYVACRACSTFYRVVDLREGRLQTLALGELKLLNELALAHAKGKRWDMAAQPDPPAGGRGAVVVNGTNGSTPSV